MRWLSKITTFEFNLIPGYLLTLTDLVSQRARRVAMLPSKHWRIAKKPPFPNLSIDHIETHHHLSDFLQVFTSFIKENIPHAPTPSKYDHFDVYKQVSLILPPNRYIGANPIVERIRTTPARGRQGREPGAIAQFDTAFVIERPTTYMPSSSLEGEHLIPLNQGLVRLLIPC